MNESWRWGARPGDVYGGGAPEWRERGAVTEAWLVEALACGMAGFAGEYAGKVLAMRERAREITALREASARAARSSGPSASAPRAG